jgi:hypothetical protein
VLQRWGKGSSTSEPAPQEQQINYRYRCEKCTRTFRHSSAKTSQELAKHLIRNVAEIA